jgi:hypothetical protein
VGVGFDRAVRSAKATVPFLARFTGQGVEAGDNDPVIVRFTVPLAEPKAFVAVSVMVNPAGLVGMPEIVPVLAFRLKPCGRKLAVKLVGLFFVLGVKENGVPVVPFAF